MLNWNIFVYTRLLEWTWYLYIVVHKLSQLKLQSLYMCFSTLVNKSALSALFKAWQKIIKTWFKMYFKVKTFTLLQSALF